MAAGMYNPIVFKRLNKSWMADDLLPALKQTYTELEQHLAAKILHEVDMIRIFSSHEQQNDWMVRSQQSGYEAYLSLEKSSVLKDNGIENQFGYGVLKGSGWVDLPTFLFNYRDKLKKQEQLIEDEFDYSALEVGDDSIVYKELISDKIIFCEGNQVRNNPFFNDLPFTLTKGEVLTVKIDDLVSDKVLNKGFFMLPQENSSFKVGATYNWSDKTETPTEEGKKELQEKLGKIWEKDYVILEHKAGVRPTTKDRRPIIGQHPTHKNLYVFNGLGTKGVMIAPYFATHFCDYLIEGVELNKEVDLGRFRVAK